MRSWQGEWSHDLACPQVTLGIIVAASVLEVYSLHHGSQGPAQSSPCSLVPTAFPVSFQVNMPSMLPHQDLCNCSSSIWTSITYSKCI